MMHKLQSKKVLLARLKAERTAGKTIVACCGSFDVLTAKHTNLLEDFKRQGDVLVVFLNSDRSVRSYKGPNRPIMPERERAELLAALQSVDYVCLFDEINPLQSIETFKPDIYCNGGDWGEVFLERDLVESYGGRVYSSAISRKSSTSDVIARIIAVSKIPEIKAVFLDRDGVIIKDKGYLHTISDVEFVPGVVGALRHLQKLGYLLIVISNQSGIGRKMYARKDADKVHAYMRAELRKKGVTLTDIYYCPHAPEKGCECRKPKPGMILTAAKKYNISLARSYVIGDRSSDIEAGKVVNCKTILLTRESQKFNSREHPDVIIKDMRQIARIVKC